MHHAKIAKCAKTAKKKGILVFIAIFAFSAIFASPARADRREVTVLRVPNDAITIDGRDDDWHRIPPDALARCGAVSNDAKLWSPMWKDRGEWTGPDDCSMKTQLAVDDANFYVLADVRDQFIVNTGKAAEAYNGDDFEIFIDASPPESRFTTKGENFRQLIFVPLLANPDLPGTYVWMPDQNPGVVAASRLRPWGYTIEVKIPKALLPNWRAHPDLDSIGLDIMTADADAPGVDCLHPAVKGARYLLEVANHFQTPEKLSVAKFEKTPVTMIGAAATTQTTTTQTTTTQATTTQAAAQNSRAAASPASAPTTNASAAPSSQPVAVTTSTAPATTSTAPADPLLDRIRAATLENADAVAQEILDAATSDRAAALADAALRSPHLVIRKVGAFVLAQRPTLDAPIDVLVAIVGANMATTQPDDLEIRKFSLMALARSHKLPVDGLFDAYAKAGNDSTLRLTYIWCAGVNGDKTIGPKLITLLSDPNLRIRMMTALSLGTLREASATDALKAMAEKDPHQYGQTQAKLALEQIGAK